MRIEVSAEAVRAAFDAVKDDPSFDESRGLTERGLMPVEMLQAMSLRPEILRAFAGFGALRLSGRSARAARQGAGDHHRVARRTTASSAPSRTCDLVRIEGIVDEPHRADRQSADRDDATRASRGRLHASGDGRFERHSERRSPTAASRRSPTRSWSS